ncbi:hypothetical protein BV898_11386 [Hypsibius exemplaris]|uniref:Spaetzle domain-containing protein n=1 Tax=Hypsibius exemplaris TaxID=2072580 RepID=A0A1W0WGT4_HYPEX|nr:hypothetical protein BV898_11386 [Hypsibius exemplaris]
MSRPKPNSRSSNQDLADKVRNEVEKRTEFSTEQVKPADPEPVKSSEALCDFCVESIRVMSYFTGKTVGTLLVILMTSRVRGGTPTSCGSAFCERSREYPVNSAFQRSMESDPRFAALKGSVVPKVSSAMSDDDPNLPADDTQYQICKSKTDIIFPQEAQNTRGERKFIINFGPFVQGITIERCMSDSFRMSCNYIGTPPDYQSVCVQKEIENTV